MENNIFSFHNPNFNNNNYYIIVGISGLKSAYNVSRGYHLICPLNTKLSDIFVQAVKSKKGIICSTDELISINDRRKESIKSIYLLTNSIIDNLINEINEDMDLIVRIIDGIALLDMLLSFANHITLHSNYIRPIINDKRQLVIKQGRSIYKYIIIIISSHFFHFFHFFLHLLLINII